MIKSLSVLGCTGSIGTQTLDAARQLGLRVEALAAHSNIKLLEAQAREFKPRFVAVYEEEAARALKRALADTEIAVASGAGGLKDAAEHFGDCVVTALSGAVGLRPTLAAMRAGRRIALANKETLVCGGSLVMARAKETGTEIIPVDSEHSAIFQCLAAQGDRRCLKRIILTGSGGPFRGKVLAEMEGVTPKRAIRHPNWKMGAKISVDSATLMNKGLEFIEAMHLFGVSPEQIEVIIHPESIIHSMAVFDDGCVMAQLGVPDMKLPIRYALTYPERAESDVPAPDFAQLGKLHFFEPDLTNFPCLKLAMDCAKFGGTASAVMNAANEKAVAAFLSGETDFLSIYELAYEAVSKLSSPGQSSLEEIEEADFETRAFVRARIREERGREQFLIEN
ncbi:MAG: 1-deoxy-D-xylulose-5-phosphate reductoisomerase [Oscillospiraceae bacterium]|jgi:1-deoxy-D-xylulose-5-phosphate reductoisomerase|nr:1-deoxy-D-xylulose-5-phosphate reductoisomerase [Oscillospiraceae bacterium]